MTHRSLRILGISGSLRRASFNSALLREAGAVMPAHMSLEVASIGDLQLYNGDVEKAGLPDPVHTLRTRVADVDAVLFACPEYNWSITGSLKNAIDWLSRNPASPLDHKPAAIVGGGGGGGGARAQAHLREVLAHNRVDVYEESEVVVPRVWGAFDDAMQLVDERVAADLGVLIEGFAAHVERDASHRPAVLAVGTDAARVAPAFRALIADYRVSLAFDAADIARQVARWSPVAVVDTGGEIAAEAGAAPVVPVGDPAALLDAVAQAIAGQPAGQPAV